MQWMRLNHSLGCIVDRGTMELQVVQGRQDADERIGILERSLLFMKRARSCGEDWIFQQDDAAIHTNHRSKDFLQANSFRLLDHLPCSPDLNS